MTIGQSHDRSAGADHDHATQVTELLLAIPELDSATSRGSLAKGLRKQFKNRFPSLPAYPTIPRIVDALSRMDNWPRRLRELCQARQFDLFLPDSTEVKDLIRYLDSIPDIDDD